MATPDPIVTLEDEEVAVTLGGSDFDGQVVSANVTEFPTQGVLLRAGSRSQITPASPQLDSRNNFSINECIM